MSKWALFISDLHAGSAFSLWPKGVRASTGTIPKPNRGQRYLLKHWEKIKEDVKEITRGQLDVLFNVGDTIQGANGKNEAEFLVETDLAFQGKAAVQLLAPLREMSKEFFQLRGSRYHVGPNADTEEWVASCLGATRDELGHSCWLWLPDFEIEGVVFDISHHQSAVQVNRSMPLERERRYSNQLLDIKRKPDLIVRAHGHIGAYVEIDGEASLGLYPLQLQTPFAKTSTVPNRYLSRYLGAWLVELLPERRGTMLQPFQVYPLRFKHPKLARVKHESEGKPWTMEEMIQILA
jgi:hypothetical protein